MKGRVADREMNEIKDKLTVCSLSTVISDVSNQHQGDVKSTDENKQTVKDRVRIALESFASTISTPDRIVEPNKNSILKRVCELLAGNEPGASVKIQNLRAKMKAIRDSVNHQT